MVSGVGVDGGWWLADKEVLIAEAVEGCTMANQ